MASESTRQRVVWLKRLGSWKLVKNRCITEKQNTQVREESWGGGGNKKNIFGKKGKSFFFRGSFNFFKNLGRFFFFELF